MPKPPSNPVPIEQLTRQLLRNSALMVLSRGAAILVLVLSVPVIVECLGPDGYGVWESLMAIAAAAVIFQVVINGTVMWRISMSFGVADGSATERMVRIGVGATIMLILLLLPPIWWARESIVSTLQVPARWQGECRWLLPLVVAIMLLGGINQALLAVIIGYQRAGVAALVQSVGLVATHITSIIALLVGYGLDALLFGYLIGLATIFVIVYPLATSLCGRISLMPLRPSWRELWLLAPFAGLLLLSNLTLVFRDHADKLVLSSLVSPATTGYFGMAQRLASIVMQVCLVIYTPFTAAIGALYARDDWASVSELYSRASGWMGACAGVMTVLLATLHRPVFVLWLGAHQPEATGFLVFLLLGTASAIIFAGAGVALAKGIGRPGLETLYTMVTLLLIVLTKPLFIVLFGPAGAVASSAASWCLGALCFLLLLHAKVDLPRRLVGRTIAIFVLTMAASGLGWRAGEYFFLGVTDRATATVVLLLVSVPLAAAFLLLLAGLKLIYLPVPRAVAERAYQIPALRSGPREIVPTDIAA